MIIKRRHFVRNMCMACMGVPFLGTLLTACEATRYVAGTMEPRGIAISPLEFSITKDSVTTYREYVIVRNDRLEYPICVYRFSETAYSALLMKCTHQGTELQAAGDHLHCPAHGSEFSSHGRVTLGPAEQDLRTFRVVAEQDRLLIELT